MMEMVLQYVIYPLVLAIVAIGTALYRRDLKEVKTSINSEIEDRKEAGLKSEVLTEKIFTLLGTMNDKLDVLKTNHVELRGQIDTQNKICNLRHGNHIGGISSVPGVPGSVPIVHPMFTKDRDV